MNSKELEMREILEDMLHGPPVVHVVVVNYANKKSRCFVFSIPELFEEFLEYLDECAEGMEAESYVRYTSLVDVAYDHEYEFWMTEH